MNAPQLDIFGGETAQATDREPDRPIGPVAVEQPRLFEPQLEGQLDLADTTGDLAVSE